jgi:hypothetical protein
LTWQLLLIDRFHDHASCHLVRDLEGSMDEAMDSAVQDLHKLDLKAWCGISMSCRRSSCLPPKDHRSDLDVAFEDIINIGTKQVDIFTLLSSNRLMACCPIVLCILLWVMAFVP